MSADSITFLHMFVYVCVLFFFFTICMYLDVCPFPMSDSQFLQILCSTASIVNYVWVLHVNAAQARTERHAAAAITVYKLSPLLCFFPTNLCFSLFVEVATSADIFHLCNKACECQFAFAILCVFTLMISTLCYNQHALLQALVITKNRNTNLNYQTFS